MGQFKKLLMQEFEIQKPLPKELRAVLNILAAEPELIRKTLTAINFEVQEINWDEVNSNEFTPGQAAALSFARAISTDGVNHTANPFLSADALDARLKSAVVKSIAISWGLAA